MKNRLLTNSIYCNIITSVQHLMIEEKYEIFISIPDDCQCQLIDKWQCYLIKKVWHAILRMGMW